MIINTSIINGINATTLAWTNDLCNWNRRTIIIGHSFNILKLNILFASLLFEFVDTSPSVEFVYFLKIYINHYINFNFYILSDSK